MPLLYPHVITVGATKIVIKAPDIYEDIGTIVGVNKVTAGTASGADASSRASELLRSGQAVKVRVRYGVAVVPGTPAGPTKTADIICDVEKAPTVVNDLLGKSFKGATIRSAVFPRRARYS